MRTIVPLLFVGIAGVIFVHALMRTSEVNAQLRALEKPPMRNFVPILGFVTFFIFGFFIGLAVIDAFVVYRNRRARQLIAATGEH